MIYFINNSKIESIKFRHLDYYDALAEYQRRNSADDSTKPWCYIREGSEVTLCTIILDNKVYEGWSHKVPKDAPYRPTGKKVALHRALLATGKDKAWRKDFWNIYFAGQKYLSAHSRRSTIRLVGGIDVRERKAKEAAQGESPIQIQPETDGGRCA